jgi:hypothetical protein
MDIYSYNPPLFKINESCAHLSTLVISDLGLKEYGWVVAYLLMGIEEPTNEKWRFSLLALFRLSPDDFDAVMNVLAYMYKLNKKPRDLFGTEFVDFAKALYSPP